MKVAHLTPKFKLNSTFRVSNKKDESITIDVEEQLSKVKIQILLMKKAQISCL